MSFLTLHWLRDDDGISLVEIMVSIVILGVALTAFAGTITKALATITQDEQFVRGNQLAADLVEEVRAQPWYCVGLDATKPGWSATAPGGQPMARMENPAPAGQAPCVSGSPHLGTATRMIDQQSYAVQREIVWIDDPAIPGTQDHKRVTVQLDWTVRGRAYSATQESLRTPSQLEVPVTGAAAPPPATNCSGQITAMSITPGSVAITASGLTDEAVVVVVETCSGTTGVTLRGAVATDQLSTRSMVAAPAGSTTRWELSFPRGTPNFTAGTKNWIALGSGTAPLMDREVTRQIVFYNQAALPPVQILTVDGTPQLCVESNGRLRRPTTLTITVQGITSDAGVVTARPDKGTAITAVFATATSTGSTWTLTIATGVDVGTNNKATIFVNATRNADNAKAAEVQPNLSVTSPNSNTACPP